MERVNPAVAGAGRASAADEGSPWPEVLDEETSKPYFRDLLKFIDGERARGVEIYPLAGDVFAAFRLTPCKAVKVVIVGQDPYPNPGEAMGLAFSVPRGVRKPRSLVNIAASMRIDGFEAPEHGDLTDWAQHGVLLLNTALTVPRGRPGAHLAAWRPFTDAVIRRVNAGPPVVFVLWGAKAQRLKKRGLIDTDRHRVIEAPHPAARGAAQQRFRDSHTFLRVNAALDGPHHDGIVWGPPILHDPTSTEL